MENIIKTEIQLSEEIERFMRLWVEFPNGKRFAKMKNKTKITLVASILAVLLVGCTITPIQPVVVTPGNDYVVPATTVYVTPGPVIVEPEFVDVVVPGIWMYEGGRRVWHSPRHERRSNPRHRR